MKFVFAFSLIQHLYFYSILDALYNSTGSIKSIDVEVQRVDFGDTACLSLKDLRELSRDIAAYPAQALQVALANVSC